MKNMFYLLLLVSRTSLAQEWKTNLDEAKSLAQSKTQNSILVLSGLDWCAPFIKLDHDIFAKFKIFNFDLKSFDLGSGPYNKAMD